MDTAVHGARTTARQETSWKIGTHVVAELVGCEAALLNRLEDLRRILRDGARRGGLTIVGERFHQFEPHGVTGVVVLAESHISIHTWPERGVAALDVFTCGDPDTATRAFEAVVAAIAPERVQSRVIDRSVSRD